MNIVRFGDVASRLNIHVDQATTTLEYYIGGEHIKSRDFMVHEKAPIKGSTIGYQFQFGFEKGDILFMTKNPHLRKASMVDFNGLCSIATFVIRSNDESVLLQDYLLLEMQSDRFWDYCEEHKSGGVNYFINWGTLSNYEFPLPSIDEQKVLAEKLWAAYEVKQSYLKMIDTTQEMVKAQFIEMFGTLDNPKWKTVFLPDISENLDYKRIPIKSGNRDKGQYPYYGASGIVDYVSDYIFDEDVLLISEDGANLKDRVTPIAFSSSGKVWVNNHAHVLTFRRKATQLFIEHYFNYNRIDGYLTGTAQPKLNQDKLNSIPVPNPDETTLSTFEGVCQQADKSISELRKSIDAIDKVIKSLINENL